MLFHFDVLGLIQTHSSSPNHDRPRVSPLVFFVVVVFYDVYLYNRYRFANEPESVVGDYRGGGTLTETTTTTGRSIGPERKMYGGRVRIRLRDDGYSDILTTTTAADDNDDVDARGDATFIKVWGWDLEIAESSPSTSSYSFDGGERRRGAEGAVPLPEEYLLFSADVRLPPPFSAVERFHFQASVTTSGTLRTEDGEGAGVLSLSDGTVSVKRDVAGSGGMGGWWGLFRGANGILAEFCKVGEFRCRPTSGDSGA